MSFPKENTICFNQSLLEITDIDHFVVNITVQPENPMVPVSSKTEILYINKTSCEADLPLSSKGYDTLLSIVITAIRQYVVSPSKQYIYSVSKNGVVSQHKGQYSIFNTVK